MSRSKLYVDLKAIIYNYKLIEKTVYPATVMVVLKADAYGLGLQAIAKSLDNAGVRRFGVASIEEALTLKNITSKPIQILGELLPEEIEPAIENDIICPGSSENIIKSLSELALSKKKLVKVHYLLDSGMGRLGIPIEEASKVISKTLALPNLHFEGIYTHFPFANNPKHPINNKQISLFKNVCEQFPFALKHMANSDAINNLTQSYFNMVRTGINLFGVYDLLGHHLYQLKPTLTLETSLIANRLLKKGSTIGYGCTHTLKENTRIGTIPIGYADGLPFCKHKQKEVVLIEGKLYPIIGRVSMDYATIDLGTDDIPIGKKVIIIGRSQSNTSNRQAEITVENLAEIKSTHPYDIICSIGNRVRRIYKN